MAQAKYLSGDVEARPYPIDTTTDFQVGDLVYCDAADGFAVKPAGDFTWTSTLATTQTNFALRFAGVVMATYAGTAFSSGGPNEYGLQSGEVMVAQRGVFEFDCASATFYPGTLVGPAKQSGNLLEPQKVVQTSTEATSIGRVWQKATSATRVKINIYSQLNDITTSAESGS